MTLPPFLLLDDSYTDVQAFIALVKRIGIANAVRPFGSIIDARRFLSACEPVRLPVVVFSGGIVRDGLGETLIAWMQEQEGPVGGIPGILLEKPLDMYAVIDALKALELPERTKIDTTTLTVRVELWPRGTDLKLD
jgi:hypothetical protein